MKNKSLSPRHRFGQPTSTKPHPLSDSRCVFSVPNSPVHLQPLPWLLHFTSSWLISLLRPLLITWLNSLPSARQWGQLCLWCCLNHLFRQDSQKCWPQHTARWGSRRALAQIWQMKRSGTLRTNSLSCPPCTAIEILGGWIQVKWAGLLNVMICYDVIRACAKMAGMDESIQLRADDDDEFGVTADGESQGQDEKRLGS